MKKILSIGSSKVRLTPTELSKIKGSDGCACCICSPGNASTGVGGTSAASKGTRVLNLE